MIVSIHDYLEHMGFQFFDRLMMDALCGQPTRSLLKRKIDMVFGINTTER